ncbi:TetR/AcrR family transcriptional regulator [Ochrobactrum pecoris]|uniref:TetR/AcrR family transcriptional regulator n=2 Tax=Brucella pecoris TaxID=867683 RepID=A0A5C5CEJ6_9HYPH|nr:TetR/AcrR family transcriptional regulator [Brucella pecoris]NKW81821.1 TetR/AcrR family transcriptional regulator [Brucella pecoris]TNV09740.1 TetR/AcrR family transcriptional regulator [Brucella pecoris]
MAPHSIKKTDKEALPETGSTGRQQSGRGRSKGGRPSRQALEELNRRILDTATGLFASQGFAATSMEQVALACNAGKDTIYRRYPSKAALFAALMQGLQSQVLDELDALMAREGTSLERLRLYARALLAINLRPQMVALNRVALGEAVGLGGVQPTPVAQDPIMARFASLIVEAQVDHLIAKGDPLFIAEQLLYATSIKPLISTMLGEGRFSDTAEEERYFDQAWQLFMQGGQANI